MSINDALRVVLVRSRNPLNIGAAARAMTNFGFRYLRVVGAYEVAFREARSAVGGSRVLAEAEEYGSVQEAVADCGLVVGTTAVGHRELKHPIVELEQGAERIRNMSCRIALLFGSEKHGLSNQDLSYCQWLLRIPTHDAQPSMNLAQAVAICLYELNRPLQAARLELSSIEPASAMELDRLTTVLAQALRLRGYTSEKALPSTEEKVRRLLRRLNLSNEDANLLTGMLRHIVRPRN